MQYVLNILSPKYTLLCEGIFTCITELYDHR